MLCSAGDHRAHPLSVLETRTSLHHYDTNIPIEDRDGILTAHFGRQMKEQIEENLRQEYICAREKKDPEKRSQLVQV